MWKLNFKVITIISFLHRPCEYFPLPAIYGPAPNTIFGSRFYSPPLNGSQIYPKKLLGQFQDWGFVKLLILDIQLPN